MKFTSTVTGYPRIGALRELKFWTEDYFKGAITAAQLEANAAALRIEQWTKLFDAGINHIPSNDFSFYDRMLDTAVMLNIVPDRYKKLKADATTTYFAMARGYQGVEGDVKALPLKKWFNTNYHYIVPEIDAAESIALTGKKPIEYFVEAKRLGIPTRPTVIGPMTFLGLSSFANGITKSDCVKPIIDAYTALIDDLRLAGALSLQIEEPILTTDLSDSDIELFVSLYKPLLKNRKGIKVTLLTYFGDVRDCYSQIVSLGFDGIGLDFVEGRKTLDLIRQHGFPEKTTLFAGVVNGKNIWKNNYSVTLALLEEVAKKANDISVSTSCSLLHVPYTLEAEDDLTEEQKNLMAFANEKLVELTDLASMLNSDEPRQCTPYIHNVDVLKRHKASSNAKVHERMAALNDSSFVRKPARNVRAEVQAEALKLPLFPTTTIGSFPQTRDVKINRSMYKRGVRSKEAYEEFNKDKIVRCLRIQEAIGLDVLVHGEYERNDMVEYFGEHLNGFLFTKKGWVQSYGTRCVKPPIVYGDVERKSPITVEYAAFAQSNTNKIVKGMLTGPVTILNWSFPREDVPLRQTAMQIALAIRDEVLDLEKCGMRIIQIDEAALKEKLPLRKSEWYTEYLDWAIPAFRLVHSGVKPTTQIHTHMCYSEFDVIVDAIDDMDADVISFEASRSNLRILDALKNCNFDTAVGPGVYDIHSPRVPSTDEMECAIAVTASKLDINKIWVNPDCGLKTRSEDEAMSSLRNLVAAAKSMRRRMQERRFI